MADGEHCDCWVKERCDFPAPLDDHCPREHYEFPEEQAGYQELRAEEHSHLDGREHCYLGRHCSERHCLERHCSDRRGVAHSGFLDRQDVGCCSADRGDSQGHCSAVPGEVLHHDCRARSVVLDGWADRSAGLDDFRRHLAGWDDLREHSAGRGVRPGQEDSVRRGLRVAKL